MFLTYCEALSLDQTRCPQVVIGKTDCLLDKKFCDSENVTGFPGIKFYANGLGIDRDEVTLKYKSNIPGFNETISRE